MPAIAISEERCCITGEVIAANDSFLLGWTNDGDLVPLHNQALMYE
jgi:hypothetical protein